MRKIINPSEIKNKSRSSIGKILKLSTIVLIPAIFLAGVSINNPPSVRITTA